MGIGSDPEPLTTTATQAMNNYAGANSQYTKPYTITEILHFQDGSSAVTGIKKRRCNPFDAVTHPCSDHYLAAWQDMNPSIVGVTFQYDPD